ncbi:hypothetical protein [Haloarchaeobius sp. DFWS5]|uniref:hypothetical protein n=1 Tax=Haloarchaeobius sp. DFWS5 TaxID=3446114 RepID=UPI003EC0606D
MAAKRGATVNDLDEEPIERVSGKVNGGSLRAILGVDVCREFGIEPGEMSSDDKVVWLASKSKVVDGRLVLDLVEAPE